MSGATSTSRTRRWKPPQPQAERGRLWRPRHRPRYLLPRARAPPGAPVIVLGVDPGSLRTGYGAIDTDGHHHRLVERGVFAPPRGAELPERLRFIHEALTLLIRRLEPDVLAVEDVFHSINSRTALVLGHVRGVIL